MEFDKEFYKNEFDKLLRESGKHKFFIKRSIASFKINKFIKKGTDSFELANFIKNSKQGAKDHWTITICYYAMLYLSKAAILKKRL